MIDSTQSSHKSGKKLFQKITRINPLLVFSGIWVLTAFLYSLDQSSVIIYGFSEALFVILIIIPPFALGFLFASLTPKNKHLITPITTLENPLRKRIYWAAFYAWVALSAFEAISFKGTPAIWLATGDPRTYFDFGFKTIHGLLNSIIFALSTIGIIFYFKTKQRKYLIPFLAATIWGALIVSRQMIIITSIQAIIVTASLTPPIKSLRTIILSSFFIVILFGILGDIRTGKDEFRETSGITEHAISAFPSGFSWVYIYITTPLNNLIHNIETNSVTSDAPLEATLSQLIPSVIRGKIYNLEDLPPGVLSPLQTGNLVQSNFNVSTAFMPLLIDHGLIGVIIYSMILGVISGFIYFSAKSFRGIAINAVWIQCLAMSIFYNHFLYLPVIFQLFWMIVFIKSPRKHRLKPPKIHKTITHYHYSTRTTPTS